MLSGRREKTLDALFEVRLTAGSPRSLVAHFSASAERFAATTPWSSGIFAMLIIYMILLAGCASLSHVPQAHRATERPAVYPLGIVSASYAPEFHMDDSLRDKWHDVRGATATAMVYVVPTMIDCLAAAAAPGAWVGIAPVFCLTILALFIPGIDHLGDSGTLEKMSGVEKNFVEEMSGSDTQTALSLAVSRYLDSVGNGADLVALSDIPGPKAIDESPHYTSAQLKAYASVLELGMQRFEFSGTGKKDSLPCMFMSARARLIDAGSGSMMDELNYKHRVACYSPDDWLAEDGKRLLNAVLNGYRLVVENIVDEILLIYHPDQSAEKTDQRDRRGVVPAFVLAPVDPPAPEMGIKWGHVFSLNKKRGGVQGFGGMQFRDVGSLTPRFSWERYPPREIGKGAADSSTYKDVVYDLRIYSSILSGVGTVSPLHLLQEISGIVDPLYQLDQPLEPCSWYFWTVRARFRLNGAIRSTEWGGAYKTLGGDFFPSYSRRHGHSIRTPWPANYLYYPFRTPDSDNTLSCWQRI